MITQIERLSQVQPQGITCQWSNSKCSPLVFFQILARVYKQEDLLSLAIKTQAKIEVPWELGLNLAIIKECNDGPSQ